MTVADSTRVGPPPEREWGTGCCRRLRRIMQIRWRRPLAGGKTVDAPAPLPQIQRLIFDRQHFESGERRAPLSAESLKNDAALLTALTTPAAPAPPTAEKVSKATSPQIPA